MTLESLSLQGRSNIFNSMAATIGIKVFDMRKDFVKESLCNFQNIEHRIESVGNIHGIEFINDSKATNINSTWYTLECMTKPVIWIVSGVNQKKIYVPLLNIAREKVKAIICLGKNNMELYYTFKNHVKTIIEAGNMSDAVTSAYYQGKPGDAVVLSPASPSFDLYKNFEDRGRQFRQVVKEL